MIKNCLKCGKEFTAYKNQRYCSKECSSSAKYENDRNWHKKNTWYMKQYTENYNQKEINDKYYKKHREEILAKRKEKQEEEKKNKLPKIKKLKNVEKLKNYQHWYYINVTKPKRQSKFKEK